MVWLALYIATIFLANWLLQTFGILDLGIAVPAGTLAAGLSFTARDLVQDSLGRLWTVGAIIVGAAVSALVSPQLALASGVTFLVSESLDFAVYTPIRERNWTAAVAASNIVGLTIDSVLFLLLAFGSLAFLPGQIVGKVAMTVLALLILVPLRRRGLLARHPSPKLA